jgi:hypothetical protein
MRQRSGPETTVEAVCERGLLELSLREIAARLAKLDAATVRGGDRHTKKVHAFFVGSHPA